VESDLKLSKRERSQKGPLAHRDMSLLRLSHTARPVGGALRRLSTAAALPMEAPIKMYGIAGRYTNAIYAAAAQKSELLQVESDLKLFKETTESSAVLRNFVIDPSIPRSAKVAGVMSLCAESGACDSTKNALAALAEGGRMGDVFKVIDMYSELLSAAKGEVNAVITSAEPLKKEEKNQIMSQLSKMTDGSKGNVSVTTKIDPSLIAGMTISFGDKFIDMSVASQMKRLNALLTA